MNGLNSSENLIQGIACTPPESSTISFNINGKAIIILKEDGIHYKGRLLEMDKEIEDAFRNFLTEAGSMK